MENRPHHIFMLEEWVSVREKMKPQRRGERGDFASWYECL